MTIFDPKTLLIAASLISGGTVGGVSALDGNALEAVHEAMATDAPPADLVHADVVAETEVVIETEVEVEAETVAELEAAPEAEESTTAVAVHPGRRAPGVNGRGAMHRSPRATEALERAAARSPLTNRGAEHRSERAAAAIERAADRSASRPSRGRSGERGMSRGKARGPRS